MKDFMNVVNREIKKALKSGDPLISSISEEAPIDGGKRLRANLLFAFSGLADRKSALSAAAIELIHTATLVHDDILDKSSRRRGGKSLHEKIGVPESVLYGDYLFARSYALTAELEDSRILREIVTATSAVLRGEMREQSLRGNLLKTEGTYFSIIEDKTGALFAAAAKIGALLAGADEKRAKRAFKFGLLVGTAYQVLDDCIDYSSLEGDKQKFRDIKGGIATLPLILFLGKCTPVEKKTVKRIFGNGSESAAEIKKLVKKMKDRKVFDDSVLKAKKLLLETEELEGGKIKGGNEDAMSLLNTLIRKTDHVKT